jgi:fructose-1,6-bisphosphatase/inositol monophosphatase family enzyme
MDYGVVSGPVIGIVMKEMVRRAIEVIRAERFLFEAQEKKSLKQNEQDFVTTADKAAQQVYLKLIRKCFPSYGVVAEEDALSIPSSHAHHDIYFTVDPLDGTKAFMRRQSHGIGSMISLVVDGEVVAAYVGDIMTQEIFGYRPESSQVWRISEYGKAEELTIFSERPLSERHILLRDPGSVYSEHIQKLLSAGAFKSHEIVTGSIGIMFARLWKDEVAAIALHAGHETPWDLNPLIGISKKMGFVFVRVTSTGSFEVFEPQPVKTIEVWNHETVVVHRSHLDELLK